MYPKTDTFYSSLYFTQIFRISTFHDVSCCRCSSTFIAYFPRVMILNEWLLLNRDSAPPCLSMLTKNVRARHRGYLCSHAMRLHGLCALSFGFRALVFLTKRRHSCLTYGPYHNSTPTKQLRRPTIVSVDDITGEEVCHPNGRCRKL